MAETFPINPILSAGSKQTAKLATSSKSEVSSTLQLPSSKNDTASPSFATQTAQTEGKEVTLFLLGHIQNGTDVKTVNIEDLLANAKTDYSPKTSSDGLGLTLSESFI